MESDAVHNIKPEHGEFMRLAMAGRNRCSIPGLHAMIFSYFDDSSDKRREEFFAAGGLIGGEDQWFTFDLRWLDETRELNEPFRSTDCECGHGQFETWEKPKRDDLMRRLVGVIRWYHLSAFASIVPISEYLKVFPNADEFEPYYLAVAHTIVNMATIGDRAFNPVKLWFEESSTSVNTLKIFHSLRSVKTWTAGSRLRGIDFDSKKLCPLQAADLVAREAFKHMDNLGKRKTRIPVKQLEQRLTFIVWTRPALEYLRANGGPTNYELLTSWGDPKWGPIPQMKVFYRNFGDT